MIIVPSKMGRINTRTSVGQLQKLGPASRADLARVMGISHPTTGRILDDPVAGSVPGRLAECLEASAVVIAGALNVLGLGRVVLTGSLLELGAEVSDHLSRAVNRGTMWARFGKVKCATASRRRTAGLVAVGIDRIVIPMSKNQIAAPSYFHGE